MTAKAAKMMRGILIEKFGGPKVMTCKNIEIPSISDSEVLVRIKCAGVNPVDTYIREGAFLNLPELPFTPGKDGSGIIEELGKNVKGFQKGQRVFICNKKPKKYGTYAEYAITDELDVFPLAERLTFSQGAALGIPYFTAYRALVIKGKAREGETVLVHGASGAVGLATVQLGRALNLNVIGTAGTEEGLKLVEANGAHHVLCHKAKGYLENVMEITENKGVDIVIEMLSNVNLGKDLEVLGNRGRIMVVGCRGSVSINPRLMMGPETEITGVALLNSTYEEWNVITNSILQGIEKGWVNPVIDKSYRLEDAPKSHDEVIHSKGAKGKLVINVDES